MAADNKSLGMFVLSGIAPAPRGVPQIEVTFNIDANGILTVTAKDKGTGKENNITIQNSGNMSKEDIEKAQKEAELHADEDKKKREIIDAKNQLENAIYQAEKMPSEFKDKISKEDEEAISKAVEEAKKHQNSEDKDELEKASKDLQDAIMPIGAKLYQAQSAEASDAKESDKKDDEPVEGEVIDKKFLKRRSNNRASFSLLRFALKSDKIFLWKILMKIKIIKLIYKIAGKSFRKLIQVRKDKKKLSKLKIKFPNLNSKMRKFRHRFKKL